MSDEFKNRCGNSLSIKLSHTSDNKTLYAQISYTNEENKRLETFSLTCNGFGAEFNYTMLIV
jgi:hypothetical protein